MKTTFRLNPNDPKEKVTWEHLKELKAEKEESGNQVIRDAIDCYYETLHSPACDADIPEQLIMRMEEIIRRVIREEVSHAQIVSAIADAPAAEEEVPQDLMNDMLSFCGWG